MSGLSIPATALPQPSHHAETPTEGLASPSSASLRYHLGGSQALPLLLLGSDPLAAVGAEQAGGTGRAAAREVCHSSRLSQSKGQVSCGGYNTVCWHRPPNTLPPPRGDGALKHFVSRYPGRWPRVLGHSGAAGCVPRQGRVPGKEAAQDAAQPVQQAVLGPFTQQAGACLELAGSRACSPAQGSALCLGARTTVQAPGAGSLASQLDSNLAPRLPTCKDCPAPCHSLGLLLADGGTCNSLESSRSDP